MSDKKKPTVGKRKPFWDGRSRTSTERYRENYDRIFKKTKKKKGTCGCGRSPTGLCIGWHSLTEEQYKEKKKKYDELQEDKKKTAFHPRAIDGFGD